MNFWIISPLRDFPPIQRCIYRSYEIYKEVYREYGGKCIKCKLEKCKKWDENECNCDESLDGYGFDDNFNSETKYICIKCSISNCAICNSYGKYIKCLENYVLDLREGKCIKNKISGNDDI